MGSAVAKDGVRTRRAHSLGGDEPRAACVLGGTKGGSAASSSTVCCVHGGLCSAHPFPEEGDAEIHLLLAQRLERSGAVVVHDEPQVGVHSHGYQEAALQYPFPAKEVQSQPIFRHDFESTTRRRVRRNRA